MSQESPPENGISRRQFSLDLPTKITGIVFWGMVLVGIIISVYMLHVLEKQIEEQYQRNTGLIAYDMEQLFELNTDRATTMEMIKSRFPYIRDKYSIHAIEFDFNGQTRVFGESHDDDQRIRTQLAYEPRGREGQMENVQLSVYAPGLDAALASFRKNFLITIGALIFLFGLVLQQILQQVISKPFLNMVLTADKVAGGDDHVRFDESRHDEFGYLGAFINRALLDLRQQRHALESSQEALSIEKERAEVSLNSIMDGVLTTSAEGRVMYMNPAAERLCGWTNEQARGSQVSMITRFVQEENGARVENPVELCLVNNQVTVLDQHSALVRPDGTSLSVEASVAPMRNIDGAMIGAVVVIHDVSHARRLTRQLSYQASHDALTGLYNRRMFEEFLEAALINVKEEQRHHALCYMDLDQFKIVNDTCGHMAGDELLRQIVGILQQVVREGDVIARLGGDEFGLLLENCPLSKASDIANTLREQLVDYRFVWEDKTFEVGASIGVVGISRENTDLAGIMSAADLACYAAKDMGRNRVHVYEPTDASLAERHGQMHWVSHITHALEEDRFVLYRQVIRPTGNINAGGHYEVLIRMMDNDGQFIKPYAFISAAERYQLMTRVDRWVVEQVFRQLAGDPEHSLVAINLSGNSLGDDHLLDYVRSLARQYAVDLSRVCFEITETAAISNLSKATSFIRSLKAQGCIFALDDFGSGLSSFSYLKNLPVDYVKIDGAFVKDLSSDPIDRAMVEAITRVGHVMNIKTVAEWVENEETLEILQEMGVDFVQGYYVGRPEPYPTDTVRRAVSHS